MGNRRSLARAASVDDLRDLARARLPRMVFDYIDGAAGEERTARRNREAFSQCLLRQEVLVDVSVRNLEVEVLGQRLALPVVLGPTGLNGAYWPDGDLCLARAAARIGTAFVMSTAATATLETVAQAAGPARWFQLYMLRDRGLVSEFLAKIRTAGFEVLQLTVDTAVAGRRARDIRNRFTLPFRWTAGNVWDCATHPRWSLAMARRGVPELRVFAQVLGAAARGGTISDVMQQQLSAAFDWSDLDWLRAAWPGKLVLKGIMQPADAARAAEAGMDGVVVSNHGGRQLDGTHASLEALPRVVDAAAGRLEVLLDSGVRSGVDVAKALALGAGAVQVGRAALYGLAAGGEPGVLRMMELLRAELDVAMGLAGATSVAQLAGRTEWAAGWRSGNTLQ